jgi:hypothetical protein
MRKTSMTINTAPPALLALLATRNEILRGTVEPALREKAGRLKLGVLPLNGRDLVAA